MDYKTKRPLLFLIYPANVSDCQIYEDMLENKRKGYLKEGAIVMADKGFCSYYNYNCFKKVQNCSCNGEGEHEYKQAVEHALNSSNIFLRK